MNFFSSLESCLLIHLKLIINKVMEDNTFVILLIENSDYNSQELHKLPCAKKDRIAILSLLNNSNICTDNVHKAIN